MLITFIFIHHATANHDITQITFVADYFVEIIPWRMFPTKRIAKELQNDFLLLLFCLLSFCYPFWVFDAGFPALDQKQLEVKNKNN